MFVLDVTTGKIDQVDQVRSVAERYGVVAKEGAKYRCGAEEFKSRAECDRYMMSCYDEWLRDELLKSMMETG